MMYLVNMNVFPHCKAFLTQRMFFHVSGPNLTPLGSISLTVIVSTCEAVILLIRQLLMFLAISASGNS